MTLSKKDRIACGLEASEAHHVGTITSQDVKTIMLQVAEKIQMLNTCTNEAMSLDPDGKSRDVFSEEATQRDLLGWIFKLSYDHWSELGSGRKTIGHMVSMYVDSHIRIGSDNTLRLMALGDTGPVYAAQYLKRIAQTLDSHNLPVLFKYAKDYESEEDKQKRLEKAALRKAKMLAKNGQIPIEGKSD